MAAPDLVTVTVDDPRYAFLATRGKNRLFTGTPASIYQVSDAEQVRRVVEQAVASGQRVAVRGGGHALDDLVDTPEVTALIDTSTMNAAYYDPAYQAIAVESGALLGDVYKSLYPTYGFVPPAGSCPTVGVGGFVPGAGFGTLCRGHGLIADHLYGVEVVVVDESGRARIVVATREASDPNRDLWWAHSGGGGGSFGVVTRYLFRSPDAEGAGPGGLLPSPPPSVITKTLIWPWASMTEPDFTRLVSNHGAWHAANSAPGTEYSTLYSEFGVTSHAAGGMELVALIDATVPDAEELMNSYVAAVTDGVGATMFTKTSTANWLTTILSEPFPSAPPENNRVKSKGACLRQPFSADQVATMYKYLSDPNFPAVGAMVIYSLGGQVSAVAPEATAVAQRDSILRTLLITAWSNPALDDEGIAWTRAFYRDLYAATGGVPVPNAATDGSYINFPDVDLADPAWNTSGVPWHTLYFKDNYPRLQQVKAAYDPRNVFRHPLSVQLPG
jgi:aclacinomycin oxidase